MYMECKSNALQTPVKGMACLREYRQSSLGLICTTIPARGTLVHQPARGLYYLLIPVQNQLCIQKNRVQSKKFSTHQEQANKNYIAFCVLNIFQLLDIKYKENQCFHEENIPAVPFTCIKVHSVTIFKAGLQVPLELVPKHCSRIHSGNNSVLQKVFNTTFGSTVESCKLLLLE